VAREVQEEAGVAVGPVSYVGSQPWPFPSSLMIGCYAEALDDTLTVDHTELEEADWFTRAEVQRAMAGDEDGRFIAPPSQAIAHHLLKWWLER
jgi:NAD+ diphosphatase